MRKTKIICTLGPATEKPEALRQLIQKGSDVFRLNMSHASHDWVRNIVPRIRMLAQKAGRPVALLLDTQGPAIRTGDVERALFGGRELPRLCRRRDNWQHDFG